jgi:DNA-binding PucR family transcriptional regulator
MAEAWGRPSPDAAALVRAAAVWFRDHAAELVELLDETTIERFPEPLRTDVTLIAEAAASTRANITHWAQCTIDDPGGRVPVNLSPEVLAIARDAIRRGADRMLLSAYHASQNVAWRYSMQLLFSMSSEPKVLAEALDVAARSIFQYVDDTVAALEEQIERERAELTRGTHAERLEVVSLILEGAPITSDRAAARLAYDLRGVHIAAIVWSDPGSADHSELDRAAEQLARAAGAARPLTVIASGSSIWVWFAAAHELAADAARAAVDDVPRVRVALGLARACIEGFRLSHLDALAAQRLLHNLPGEVRVARFADVELIALAASDLERAGEFVARTLGDLARADPALRDTLRAYVREEFSASRAARALFAHRNTVTSRLARAERLLPAPLDGRGLEVGLALELLHWLGPQLVAT